MLSILAIVFDRKFFSVILANCLDQTYRCRGKVRGHSYNLDRYVSAVFPYFYLILNEDLILRWKLDDLIVGKLSAANNGRLCQLNARLRFP